jgi:fructan beta-fructosidase
MRKMFFIILAVICWQNITFAQNNLYKELYRPQYHFSPAKNWCNDPNGLVYNNGTYHLFYQHNPFENFWGHMTWAHSTSNDLIHWKAQPIAIPEENGIMIFSGTCVVDNNNTSGFGKNGKAPMVAVYTGHIENVNQSQNISYSNDDGITWTKYSNNPVLDLGKKDFRDPKIFWQSKKKYWVMSVMLPIEHQVQFYSSTNLKQWTYLSSFGPVGDTSGVWECPDLVQIPIDGTTKTKWLLQLSQNASMQYFIGEFDGVQFINENPINKIFRPDYGPDYYAAISYNQLPISHKPIAISWANNWNYANSIPTTPWKSAMALPRTLSVKKINGEWILVQHPIDDIKKLRKKVTTLSTELVTNSTKKLSLHSTQFEIQLTLTPSGNKVTSGIQIAQNDSSYFEIGYNAEKQLLYIDRSKCGENNFNEKYKALHYFEHKVPLVNNKLTLQIFMDNSIVEVFANGGQAAFTTQCFNRNNNGIALFSIYGKTEFSNLKFWKMKSSW